MNLFSNISMFLGQMTESEIIEKVREGTVGDVPMEAIHHEGSQWFPRQASSFAADVDWLYMYIFWLSTIFFVIIVAVMVWFCFKYRRIEGVDPEPSPSHKTWIEIAWSVIPSVFLIYIFWVGAEGYFEMRVPREDAEEIHVTARKWNWAFTYPDGDISSELHLVLDKPVKLVMRSDDVLHGLFVPAFRQKMDIVPGRYTYAYIMPTMTGQFRLACTEYCGDEHSKMRTLCEVHISDEARKEKTQWITTDHKPWENGERLYKINCSGCHKVDGTAATGPALNDIWKKDERMITGETRLVDENYIRESILMPEKDVVEGYGPVTKMNSFQGKLTDEDIDYLIAYMRYLKTGEGGSAESAEPAEETPAAEPAENEAEPETTEPAQTEDN